jgi:hypothetical protein
VETERPQKVGRKSHPTPHNMSANDVGFVTDDDPYLQYKRKLGSGGFGTVHEVPSHLLNAAHEDL